MLPLLAILVSTAQTAPAELARLGTVTRFDDLSAMGYSHGRPEPFLITDDGRRAYRRVYPNGIFTWPIGGLELRSLTEGASYDPATKQPTTEPYAPGHASLWGYSDHGRLTTLLDAERPLFWWSGQGERGVVASYLGWSRLGADGKTEREVLLFRRERLDLIGVDVARRLVVTRDKKGLRVFRLGADYRTTKPIAPPDHVRRYERLGGSQPSADWNFALVKGGVADLRTGRIQKIDFSTWAGAEFVGNRLHLLRRARLSEGAGRASDFYARFLWAPTKVTPIGFYQVAGRSPSGEWLVLTAGQRAPTSAPVYWLVHLATTPGRREAS
jgi:hypothetical protein